MSKILEATENAIKVMDHRKIQRNMKNHEAVYRFLNHINHTFENCIFISYFSSIYSLCLCIYNVTIGGSEILIMKYFLIPIIIGVSLTLIYLSYGISRLFILFYGSNQEVRKFSISYLPIQTKLKMLCFMKLFYNKEIGFSCGGFFTLSRAFPLRVIKSLFSAFSLLLELRSLMEEKVSCRNFYLARNISTAFNAFQHNSIINL
ncbi:uncharacterized protein LOC111634559 [Centruroides sculpturatus]|uniref:uncharacterized protein LOC111634559 n=1 Tax=Centruroides sculpturatus TaxID=218467 RepID=UPI000C6D44FE|nr:uncharacterized protein LOC111634559 [Centruroides sculpturatus]